MAGGGDELKLLVMWASPFVLRVRLALSFKGMSYEYVEEDLSNKSGHLLSSNPAHKKVPVLIHNGKPVCESRIIVQYIDEAFSATSPALLPADPYERSLVRFWAAFIDDKLLSSWLEASWAKTGEEKADRLRTTFAEFETLEAAFKECSKGKPFFGGESVGYLDVILGGLVAWVRASEARHGIRFVDASRRPASSDVGEALRRAARDQGRHAGHQRAGGVRKHEGGQGSGCSRGIKQLRIGSV